METTSRKLVTVFGVAYISHSNQYVSAVQQNCDEEGVLIFHFSPKPPVGVDAKTWLSGILLRMKNSEYGMLNRRRLLQAMQSPTRHRRKALEKETLTPSYDWQFSLQGPTIVLKLQVLPPESSGG